MAWLYMTGSWPTMKVDHRNGRRDDNRWANLREATDELNARNRHRPSRHSVSGVLGVSPSRGRWKAQALIDGKNRFLGRFDTIDEAAAAYRAAILRRDSP